MQIDTITNNQQIIKNSIDHTLFSWTKQGGLNPMNIERGEGVYLYDRDGKRYLDFSSQLISVNIGHGHPKVIEAVNKQMKEVCYIYPGAVTKVRGELGKKLAEITPGDLTKTFFTLGGADAIENAIKLARVYTGRHKIVTLYRSYHGGTYGAITAGGDPRRHPVDSQQMPNVVHVQNPYAYRCHFGCEGVCTQGCLKHLESILEYENPYSVAAIILEGESGSSGCIKYPPGYWKGVKELADRYGILTIDDEVMSGFGRTGKMFAIEHHGVEPDMICMAKGLTSSYLPLGAVIVSKKIADYFDNNYMPIGLTYSAHAVSCAAALAVLKVYEEENLVENAAAMGRYLEEKMEGLKQKHPSIGDFRNTGLLGCIELVKNRATKEPLVAWNTASEITGRLFSKIKELGMFTFVKWNFVFMAPPLCITKEQIDEGLDIISEVLKIADEYYEG